MGEIRGGDKGIRPPRNGWLGTFGSAHEAALAYDRAALLKGPHARTNFIYAENSSISPLPPTFHSQPLTLSSSTAPAAIIPPAASAVAAVLPSLSSQSDINLQLGQCSWNATEDIAHSIREAGGRKVSNHGRGGGGSVGVKPGFDANERDSHGRAWELNTWWMTVLAMVIITRYFKPMLSVCLCLLEMKYL
ncbi:hypothetical protein HPP92_002108 [Vanilla planifolia]|uniref:AP2/ERF domain-containing protein n=1 Tax=Vanilla planifolia TaxID=51239 RepID=A0A835S5K9_VANPL|nr:hypothetical protein HPP92_002108 [Vanilla planifolia]